MTQHQFTLDGHPVSAAEVEAAWDAGCPLNRRPTCVLACGDRVPVPRGTAGAHCRLHGRQLIASYDDPEPEITEGN